MAGLLLLVGVPVYFLLLVKNISAEEYVLQLKYQLQDQKNMDLR